MQCFQTESSCDFCNFELLNPWGCSEGSETAYPTFCWSTLQIRTIVVRSSWSCEVFFWSSSTKFSQSNVTWKNAAFRLVAGLRQLPPIVNRWDFMRVVSIEAKSMETAFDELRLNRSRSFKKHFIGWRKNKFDLL